MMTGDKNAEGGFTLIEVVVTLALYGIIMAMVMSILLPTVKFSARYSDRDGDTAFLLFVQETLTEKIRYARQIAVYDDSDTRVTSDFARPVNGCYDINHSLFKKKVSVTWSSDKQTVSAPRKPENGTEFVISLSMLGDNSSDLTVKLVLMRNGRTTKQVEFPVRALNAPVDFPADVDEGMQAIYIE